MKYYFIYDGTERKGPYTLEELIKMAVTNDTPVWHAGLTDWVSARKIKELHPWFYAQSQEFVAKLNNQEGNYSKEQSWWKILAKSGKRHIIAWLGWLLLAGLIVFFAGSLRFLSHENNKVRRDYLRQQKRLGLFDTIKNIHNYIHTGLPVYFRYDEQHQYFLLRIADHPKQNGGDLAMPNTQASISAAGKSIQNLLSNLRLRYKRSDIKYIVVIESVRYGISGCEKAAALHRHWQSQGILFDQKFCEIKFTGSNSTMPENIGSIRDEYIVQIIPKIRFAETD